MSRRPPSVAIEGAAPTKNPPSVAAVLLAIPVFFTLLFLGLAIAGV